MGRVALALAEALQQACRGTVHDFEYGRMSVAAQVTQQGLAPTDFDNAQGIDAFVAICAALPSGKREETIYVTPEWRRVAVYARKYVPRRRETRRWAWRTDGHATSRSTVYLPTWL